MKKLKAPIRRLCRTCDLLGKSCEGAGHRVKKETFKCKKYTPKIQREGTDAESDAKNT